MEIEFSIMAQDGAGIQPLLEQFTAETGIRVRLRLLAWDSAWSMFVRSALYGDGPDLSEVGTTWVSDLVGMNALRPYSAAEIAAVGRAGAFFPAAWKTTGLSDRTWAIPWMAGARLIFYRPRLLEQSGVDPSLLERGGLDHRTFLELARRLRDAGVRVPWTAPTGYTHTTLLNIASWVWSAGGSFVREDGRATRFTEPEAMDGMESYFALNCCLAPEVRGLNALEPDNYFLRHADTAMMISGPWVFEPARRASEPIAAALPPGASFVGGSNLVIWKHSQQPEAAARLVRFLTQHPAQVRYGQVIGLLPARQESLEAEPYTSDPLWSMAVRGLRTGRTFPTIRLWGLLEDRLTAGFSAVWNDVLAGAHPRDALLKHLLPLAARLDALLQKE